ncbi:MAG: glycoside hydrolase [Oscillibacter sp.]|nr:glycoside hydrolase [Oscillibacter sp.]
MGFLEELRESLYLHRPLPLHPERSLEGRFPNKKVLKSQPLEAEPSAGGTAALARGGEYLTIRAPLRSSYWPEGAAPDGDYANFGTARLDFPLDQQDWRGYNRLRFQVRARVRGARILHLNVAVTNRGEVPIPDPYFREGATVFDLKNGEWTDCIWEFAAMPRDMVTNLCFYVFCSGHDICAAEELEYDFKDIRLEQVEGPEHEKGWVNPAHCINLSTVGYWPQGEKTAVGTVDAERFILVDADSGREVYSGAVERLENERGSFDVLDFSGVTAPGRYYLQAGDQRSNVFEIKEDLAAESLWKVVNFLYCERCGFPVPGKHSTCHQDILANHNGETITFAGGWHDAGDVSQQAAQTGEAVQALFENARRCKGDRMLYLRLMEEAQWGLDFILRTRFGDGFRATSAGATRFTDNMMGNFDDVQARVHDHAYENFLFSGIEAYAAETLSDYDGELASNALQAAKEDFAFAQKKFARTGVDPAHMFEHTYNSGLSQYYAVTAWAASCLYAASGDTAYAAAAREAGRKLLDCQEKGGDAPLSGFFYRDESHRTIVHFNHQSREHQFMQALEALCRTQPAAHERGDWEVAMRLYGGYLKAIAGNTAPYGMLPAGIHRLDEVEDAETFPYLHVTCDYEQEKENYRQQLAQGKDLGSGYVLRNFPVWFSFRGNTAVMLSMGKAAALVGKYFGDGELIQLGREQLYWMWGKNPFGQSLIYGAGENYCRQYAVLCGECVGEVPVGVETYGNEDVPYWPQNNNATFREVWIGAASRWLGLCADYMEGGKADG